MTIIFIFSYSHVFTFLIITHRYIYTIDIYLAPSYIIFQSHKIFQETGIVNSLYAVEHQFFVRGMDVPHITDKIQQSIYY